MDYKWVTDIDKFKYIAAEWDEALTASGQDNPFLLSDFILTWWKYYSSKRELKIFMAYEDGRIIAGIPLCLTRKITGHIIEHIGGYTANLTQHFSIDNESEFLNNLFLSLANTNGWRFFILPRVLEQNQLVKQGLCLNSVPLRRDIYDGGLDGMIDLMKGYNSIVAGLPKRLCRYLESGKKKALLMGGLRLDKITGTQNVRGIFTEFREMSIKSFKARGASSAFEDNTYQNFFREVFEIFDKNGRLDAHRLSLGETTLSISFAYRFGKGFKWILTAFNTDFHNLRPGHLLIDALIQEAIRNGEPYFDMYYGGELFYKQQWCNKMVPLKKIVIYRNNYINKTVARLEDMLMRFIRDIKLRLKG